MKRINVAVLGCTGLVGQQFVRLLGGHPVFAITCLTASGRSAGKEFAACVDPGAVAAGAALRGRRVRESTVQSVLDCRAAVAFSALPASVSGPLENELRAAGVAVFSNASALRMEPDVPLLIPEVNPGHLELARRQRRRHAGFVVTNPNCVVSGLAIALKPLLALGLRGATVTTFQAVSGAGRRGVAAWDILGNVVPHIAGEEEKIGRETRKILGRLAGGRVRDAGIKIYPSCSRVPVKFGHLQSVSCEFAGEVGVEAVREALAGFRGEPQLRSLPTAPAAPILVRGEADRPQPLLDAGAGGPGRRAGMAVSAGRLRRQGRRIAFFLLLHNTVRGAAGGSLLNAELAAARGLIPGSGA